MRDFQSAKFSSPSPELLRGRLCALPAPAGVSDRFGGRIILALAVIGGRLTSFITLVPVIAAA